MSEIKEEYVFTWFIEKYSYCWHKIGESLISPEFTADGLKGTVWTLQLYPRGVDDNHKGYISIILRRNEDGGPKYFNLTSELSFLDADRSILLSYDFQCIYEEEMESGFGCFILMDEVLVRGKTDYLPQDCLSVRCKIWMGEGDIQPVADITARTRIGTEQISFVHEIEGFSELENDENNTIRIRSFSKKGIALSCCCSLCDGKIVVEIAPEDTSQILSKLKISLLGEFGKKIECGEIDNRFDAVGKKIDNISLSLTRQDILNRKCECIPDDKLSLACESTLSTGVEYGKIERTVYGKLCSVVNETNVEDEDTINEEKPNDFLSAIKRAYSKNHLTDVQLKTKTNSFPAHKLVLYARSPVFNAMLTNDMKEKNTNLVEVDDIDDDILQQFLLFLYSDNVENMKWESATKLYYAADKYDVKKLKTLCTIFLVNNLNISNAIELLLLADAHNDKDLKKVVQGYILKNEKEVFYTEEWKNLIETNPLLVSKTMYLKYSRES